MELSPNRPRDLDQAALDRHVDVLVVGIEAKLARLQLAGDRVEALVDAPQLLVVQHPDGAQSARVRVRSPNVVGRQAAVEPDRAVELLESGIGRIAESAHAGQFMDGTTALITLRPVRLLVTGATGKVGNTVARRLVERGDEVVALVRDVNKARELLPAEVELAPR